MGILNVTPDSFSDGGDLDGSEGGVLVEAVVQRAQKMILEGADILDIGGEATGPGSKDVSLEEELSRVIPVIKAVRAELPEVWISVDTWKAEVARQAIVAGADMVNDVTALRGDEEMANVVLENEVPICLMYSKDGNARTTTDSIEYDDVMVTIKDFLRERVEMAQQKGIPQIILDPGMGVFVSMNPDYSYEVLEKLRELEELGFPILVGTSRKSFLTARFGEKVPKERLEGSVMTTLQAALNGAHILRVHDVKETREMINGNFICVL
ncbi:dihydropteroate synthase [Candidatus Peregrinibacteria bacterium]|nr:dihydropteroate synthase [Candidatus Peregrinibacteria bacterium]MBT7703039.1 dihydropteroate synthase [Candidatus Peregrinibacteria bacterium]